MNTIDVVSLLKRLGVLGEAVSDAELSDESAGNAFLEAMRISEKLQHCVKSLFPNEIPVGKSFFDQLDEVRASIGVSDSGDEAIGIVWSESMRLLPVEAQMQILQMFGSLQAGSFFSNARSLHVVVRTLTFPVRFLADWLTELVRITEGDIANDVWNSIKALCEFNPKCATDVAWTLSQPPTERRLSIAGVMLGTLRRIDFDEEHCAGFVRLEDFYANHYDEIYRGVYNWSWVTTARAVGIDGAQLSALLARGDYGNSEDLGSVVGVISRICLNDDLPTESFVRCTSWIGQRVSPSLPAATKYHLADAANYLSGEKSSDDKSRLEYSGWITGIQPVREDEVGTWRAIQWYLSDLAKENVQVFQQVFERLCESSAAEIRILMQRPRFFNFLLRQLQDADVSEMVGRLAMSVKTSARRLGIFLFDKLNIEWLPDVSFDVHGGLGMQLLFHEVQRTMLGGKSLARLFVSMLRHVDLSDSQFKSDLLDEIKLQLRNYSGGCREEMQERGADLPEVIDALNSVEDYFEKLKVAHEAGINAMEVAGHRHAAALLQRRLSQHVSEEAKEYSVFLSMVKEVRLLYGRTASTFICGTLQDSMPLMPFSTSTELPVVDFCDPEEMALRRIHASASIQRLLEGKGITTGAEDE